MTAGVTRTRRRWPRLGAGELDRFARPGLILAVVAAAVLELHLTRGSSFWADDWSWIAGRRGAGLSPFLSPYNGHLSLVPIVIYRLMFTAFGIGSYTPYRTVVIALGLVSAVMVFLYARRRTGDLVAALAAVLMLFLGPGWQDTLWAFQIPWLIVCVAGIGALMALDRGSARSNAGACALLVLSVASTSLGLAFLAGAAVDLALTRRRWADAWIAGVPLGLYVVWAIAYRPNAIALSQITSVPMSIAQAAAAAPSVLTGISGIGPFNSPANALTYGWPLLVLALGLVAWRARRTRPSARAASLAVTFVVFAASVSLVHVGYESPLASRYVYVYCLLALLLGAEVARDLRPSPPVQLALVVVVGLATVANFGALRSFGAFFRISGETTNGALTALELDRATVNPDTIARVDLYAFVKLRAGAYFAARDALGSPAYTVDELVRAPAPAQSAADSQLLADGDLGLRSSSPASGASSGPAPIVAAVTGGAVAHRGACVVLEPPAALAPGASATLTLQLSPGAVSVASPQAPATLAVRRFAATFTPLGMVNPGGRAAVTVRGDPAPQPWNLQISSIAPVRVCPQGS